MPIKMLLFVTRKPGMSPEDFKNHYENVHIPLVKSMGSEAFPLTHTRRYLAKTKEPWSEVYTTSQILSGPPSAFEFDCIGELTYESIEHLQRHGALLQNEQNDPLIKADCEKFMDVAKSSTVLLGEYVETLR